MFNFLYCIPCHILYVFLLPYVYQRIQKQDAKIKFGSCKEYLTPFSIMFQRYGFTQFGKCKLLNAVYIDQTSAKLTGPKTYTLHLLKALSITKISIYITAHTESNTYLYHMTVDFSHAH